MPGPHADREQPEDQRVGAVRDADAVLGPAQLGEGVLEALDLGTEDVLAGSKDAEDGLLEGGTDLGALGDEVDGSDRLQRLFELHRGILSRSRDRARAAQDAHEVPHDEREEEDGDAVGEPGGEPDPLVPQRGYRGSGRGG